MGAGAHHVREDVRVPGVALAARHRVPGPEPGRLLRVHREHPVSGRGQRHHPRAMIGLDPRQHLRVISLLAQQAAGLRMQLACRPPSGSRRLASTFPASSITSTS
jgi:hypothetical protein